MAVVASMSGGRAEAAVRPDVFACRFDGGLVLADPRTRRLLAYNESAAVIWTALALATPAESVAAELTRTYGISLARASADVRAIVAHWRELQLVEGEATAPAAAASSRQPGADRSRRTSQRAVVYAIGGRLFRTSIADDHIAQALQSVLAPFRCDATEVDASIGVDSAEDGEWVVEVNGAERLRAHEAAEIMGGIYQLMLETVHRCTDWLAILHGAAVTRNGMAYVLAGPSGSGKSTLAAALAADGFGYAADDMAALRAPAGELLPWPVPQSVKSGSWRHLSARYPRLDDAPVVQLGAKQAKFLVAPAAAWRATPRPVGALIFPCFAAAAAPEAVRLRPLEALQRLLLDRVWLGDVASPTHVERFLGWLAATPAYSIRYGEALQARGLIEQFI